jgi:PPM family protein phosphatase
MAEQARPPTRRAEVVSADDAGTPLELAAVTDGGPVRAENQDAVAVVSLRQATGGALVVADGMGGHPDGRLAAQLAVDAVVFSLRSTTEPAAQLAAAVAAANAAIAERAEPDERGRSLGTTLVAAVVYGNRATVANVGDSRAYLVRNGTAVQLSIDHSWVAEQVRAGLLSAEEAQRHPRRSRITRALLGEPVGPDLFEVNLRPGDQLLLCSDGLWDALTAERIAELLNAAAPLDVAAGALVDAALAAGSADNVTAAVCRVAPAGA